MDKSPSVIILDDDKNLRKTLSDILHIKGFHPIPLRLGQEAVERTRREKIAVALIDLRLDDMPGLEVLRRIRAESPSTECILLTGNASQDSAIEAINLGAYSYYQKPFDIDQLLLSIQHAVDRRAAARALFESQARYHTFINATADMAFLKDDQFRYLIVNEANARFFGKPIPEIIGRDDFDLMTKEAAQACRESDRRALEENGPVIAVEEVDGRFYETRKFPVPLADGRTGVGGYVSEVTGRIRAEQQMRLQSATLESSANAIVITDRQAVIRWANPAFSLLTGYRLEETVGRNPRELVKSGAQSKEFYAALWRTILDGQVWRGALVNRRKDGTLYDEEMTITPLPDASGEPQYFIAIKQDITARKQAENALQESEGHYRGLFEDSPISLWEENFSAVKKRLESLRKRGVKNFAAYLKSHPQVVAECAALVRVVNVNKATLDLYGARSKEELLGNLAVIFDTEALENFQHELAAIAEGKTRFQWEGVNQTLDGRRLEISLNWSAAPGHEDDLSRVIVSIMNITERKQAERSLQEAESKLRAIVEQVPAIVYTEDADNPRNTLYINPQIETLTGYSPAKWIGEQDFWKKAIHPDDRDKVVAEDERTTRTDEPFRVEYRLLARDGRTLWVRDEAVLVRDAHGQPLFWQGIMHDITERKQAEQSLRESEQRYQTLAEVSPAGIFRTDANGLTTYVNRRWCEIAGLEADAALGNGWLEAVHPDDRPRLAAGWQEAVGRQTMSTSDYRFLKPDGSIAWVIGQALPERDVDGKIVGYVGAITDITERKQAEQALRLSEERYRMLAENMSDTVWLMDLDLRLVYISPSVTKLCGYTLEELNALPLERQMGPDSFRRALQLFVEILSPETPAQGSQPIVRTLELEFYRKDGTSFWSESMFTLIRDPDGAPRMILGSGRDITDRKKAQEALENSEKRFRALIENSSDVIILLDPRGKELYHSPAYRNLTGYDPRDRVGKNFIENIHPDDQAEATRAFNEVLLRPSQTRGLTFRSRRRDGGWRWLEATVSNLLGEPAVQSIVLNLRDVTERWQAAQELRQSEEKFRSVIHQSVDGIVLSDEKGVVIEWNRGMETITGLEAGETVGQELWSILSTLTAAKPLPPEALETVKAGITAALSTGSSPFLKEAENTILHKNGEIRFVQMLPFTIPTEKGFMLCSISRDVTEKKKADEVLSRRVADLEVLYENGLAISGLLEEQKIGQHLIDLVGEKLAWHHAAVRLLDPETDTVRVVAFNQAGLSEKEKLDSIARLNKKISKAGEGLSGWVIQHGQPVRSGNVLADERYVRSGNVLADERYVRSFPGIRSGLYAPLKAGNRTIGAIAVESTETDAFSEQDERLLMTVAAQAAVAIENARSYQDAVRNAQRSAALHQAGLEIVRAGNDLESIYAALHRAIEGVMPSDAFTISFVDETRNEIRGVYLIEKGKRIPDAVLSWEGLNGHILRTGKPLRIGNLKQEKKLKFEVIGSDEPPCSYLAVPLYARGKIVGVVSTQSYLPNQYSAEDQAFLETLASEAVIAIENARLWKATNRQMEELSALAQISFSLRTAVSRTEMTAVILEQITKVLGAPDSALLLYDPATGENIVELARGNWARLIRVHFQPNEGLGSSIVRTHLPYQSSDITQDENLILHEDLARRPEAAIGMPLLVHNQLIGSLWAGRPRTNGQETPTPFSEAEVRMLGSIADITANAIHRARLHEQALRHADQMLTVTEIGHLLSETLNLKQIYARLTSAVQDLLPETCGMFISLYNERAKTITYASGYAEGSFIDAKQLPTLPLDLEGKDPHSRVILTGEPLITNDLSAMSGEKPGAELAGFLSQQPKSALCVPMFSKGNAIGLIQVQSYTPNRFGQEEMGLLGLVANTAAAAIENARLFDETQKSLRFLSILHNIDAAINASVDLRVTLNIILENITKEFNVDAAALLLANPYTQVLEYSASRGFQAYIVEGMRIRLGEGLAGKAALERRLVSLADLEAGAPDIFENENFVSQYAVPMVAKGQVQGVLQIFHRAPIEPDPEWAGFLTTLAGQAAIAVDNARLFENLQRSNLDLLLAYDATIQGWSNALDLRDKETEGHSQRVTDLTLSLAAAVGVRDAEMEHIRRGALLHDIGKLGIPDAILLKPAALTPEEWEIMHKHPTNAYHLLHPIEYLRPALDIPYCHHEKWDGSGYPRGLRGEQIPLAARIFAVADVWDALTSDRPYRPAWSKERALEYIREQSGKHFDPKVVEAFLAMHAGQEHS